MIRVRCNFYMNNRLIISGESTFDTLEEFEDSKDQKTEHFKDVWFNRCQGFSTWGTATVKSDDCIGYDYEILEYDEEEEEEGYSVEPISVDDILKGAFNG